jgi:hypothetical protein
VANTLNTFKLPPVIEDVPEEIWDQDSAEEGSAIGEIAASKSVAGDESVASKSSLERAAMITKK